MTRRAASSKQETSGCSAITRIRARAVRAPKRQLELQYPARWGGARKHAGRKPGPRANTPHRARPAHRSHETVHVTLRARIAPLRSQFVFPTVRLALVRATRRDPERFRILHFSVQRDHLHLIVEAADRRALSSGLRGIAIRVARYVNDLLARRGPLWSGRSHQRALKSPREARNALLYVLANFRKHEPRCRRPGVDPYSSAACFDGWQEWNIWTGMPPPFAEPALWPPDDVRAYGEDFRARSWLARVG